jgi:outer membrane translocation and assembly module TamA
VEAVTFDGSRSFSAEQLKNTFNVPVGERFNRSTLGQGLERLRQLYGDYGYLNFTVVPQLRIDKDRGTVELMISIDDGDRFTFGQLLFAGQETRAGEAHGLLKSWANLSGKRYDASLLRKWFIQNTTFLPDDGQPLRHVETHLDSSSHRADIKLTFP